MGNLSRSLKLMVVRALEIVFQLDLDFIKIRSSQVWWFIPLIPTLGRQRQVNLYEIDASLVHIVTSRWAGTGEILSKKKLEAVMLAD